MKLHLLNVISTEHDCEYISHFCNHYKQYDIDTWNIVLHIPDGNKKSEAYFMFKALYPNCNFHFWEEEFTSKRKIEIFNNIIEKLDGYILLADIDELQIWPAEPKDLVIKYGDVIGGELQDRFAENKLPKQVENTPSIFKQFPHKSNYIKEQLNQYTHKPCVFHSSYRLENSHDLLLCCEPVKYFVYLNIAHFPWNLKREEKAKQRIEAHKKDGGNYRESELILKLLYNGE